MKRNSKYQRQEYEYNINLGKQIINKELEKTLLIITSKNINIEQKRISNFLKKTKNNYKIKNKCKNERIWEQTINKLTK
tara:strand:- start:667 stop:903 length:237 start_codon:yes stop_codon:yes gene_type:complete